jgi:hypothetical protein
MPGRRPSRPHCRPGTEQDNSLEDQDIRLKDELDIGVLDQVSIVGDRLDQLLKSVEWRA